MQLKKKNRGVALLSVILAIAIVTVLGASILYASYSGLSMRLVQKTSANTFYDAESVLNEITAGIEKEMSEQYVKAYTKIMTNYGTYGSVAEMQSRFKAEFILDMVDQLHFVDSSTGLADDNQYSTAKLASYVTGSYGSSSYTVTVDTSRTGGSQMQTLTDGLILRNIQVDFTNGNYKNSISTDIKIGVPQVNFIMVSAMPDISGYAYITDSGIDVSNSLTLTLNGAAYSGNTKTATGGSNTSVKLNSGAVFHAENSDLLIANGDIVVEGAGELYTGGVRSDAEKVTSLWAENVTAQRSSTGTSVGNNKLSMLGRTYVADDVTLDGSGNSLIMGGQFYGYSSGNDRASESSAIILNGSSSTLDMSGLDTFVVAGTAFVKASSVAGKEGVDNEDVMTGDSVALKANQYAYMLSTECAGITSNPMSYAQYNKLIEAGDANGDGQDDWILTALTTTIPSLNRTLSSYGDVSIVPVFSQAEGGTVYLYLKFSEVSAASQYFMDVYNSDSTVGRKVRSYMDNYLTNVQFNVLGDGSTGLTRLITNGNYLKPGTFDTAKNEWTVEYDNDTDSTGTIASELGNYAKTYEALCTKLVTSSAAMTSTEKTRTVFENLIAEEAFNNTATAALDSLFEFDGAAGVTVTTVANVGKVAEFSETGNPVKAIIVDNAAGDAYEVTTAGGSGVLVATGDVIVKGNWNGVIICKGTLQIAANATLTKDETATGAALRMSCSIDSDDGSGNVITESFSVINLFRGGENYTLTTGNTNVGGRDMSDIRNCLTYENWTSK